MAWYQWDGDDLILLVHLQPRARKDEVAGPFGDRLKIRITAPPVDGKANAHLCAFLAVLFGVPKSRVSLESGTTGREKRLRIHKPAECPLGITRGV